MRSTLKLYQKLTSLPFGRFIFNLAVGFKAPFFSTLRPDVVTLEPAHCQINMKERRRVKNHINTINAGALCTIAELTAGLALEVTLPRDLRFIPKKMTVSYIKKAKGIITSTCRFDQNIIHEGDILLPVSVCNAANEEVFTAEITMYISKRKPKQ